MNKSIFQTYLLEILISITIGVIISLYIMKPIIKNFYIITKEQQTIEQIQEERYKEYERIYGR